MSSFTSTNSRRNIPAASDRILQSALRIVLTVLACILIVIGWKVWVTKPYEAGSTLGYNLGLSGGLAILSLLVYPMRKRFKILRRMGAMLAWFRYHIVVGIGGPVLILFHSTFHTKSMNASVAFYAMLLVVASGIVGRFVYRRVHHGLHGSILTLSVAEDQLKASAEHVRRGLVQYPGIELHLDEFRKIAFAPLDSNFSRLWRFMTLRARGQATASYYLWQIRRTLHDARTSNKISRRQEQLGNSIAKRWIYNYINAVCNASQLKSWERLFSLWHVVHVPFLSLLVFSGVVHVIAVHMY